MTHGVMKPVTRSGSRRGAAPRGSASSCNPPRRAGGGKGRRKFCFVLFCLFWKALGKQHRLPTAAGARGWHCPAQPPGRWLPARPGPAPAPPGRAGGGAAGRRGGRRAPPPTAPGERGDFPKRSGGIREETRFALFIHYPRLSRACFFLFPTSVAELSPNFAVHACSSVADSGSRPLPLCPPFAASREEEEGRHQMEREPHGWRGRGECEHPTRSALVPTSPTPEVASLCK